MPAFTITYSYGLPNGYDVDVMTTTYEQKRERLPKSASETINLLRTDILSLEAEAALATGYTPQI